MARPPEELLRAQLSAQQIIYDSLDAGLLVLDPDQRITAMNRTAARMLGMNQAQTTGKPLREVTVEPELKQFVANALTATARIEGDLALHGRHGLFINAIGHPLLDGRSRPIGAIILLNDVTRLKRLESMRSDFAANVSHELRTPITNITGYVETLLESDGHDADQATRFLQIVKRNADRLASIIEDLLSLARLEEPEAVGALERRSEPLRPIVERVVEQMDAAAHAKSINIQARIPGDLSAIVNARLIEQAVGNLLSNAIKYSPSETKVIVAGRSLDDRWGEISVSDQGPGIAPRHLPRLFERFYRVDKARSRDLGGTGLGLAIVKHIAQVHGGRAEVESVVGTGSIFRLILPRS